MSIEEFIPKTRNGIDNLGFLFGAGTSFESGYPLVAGLTQEVVGALQTSERETLDEVLTAFNKSYNEEKSAPNIEEIADLAIEHHTNSQQQRFATLREKIRDLVRDAILGVEKPDISNQVSFFERLKVRAFDRPTDVWVFTTNYDLLLEDACAEVGLKVVNGFVGATMRCFSENEFSLTSGTTSGPRFNPDNALTVRIVKLHGSVSWFQKGERVYEAFPGAIPKTASRYMVLPRRTKVIETLAPPYDRLFHLSSSVLGAKCQYLVASGFSFGDSHINDTLVTPKISSGSLSFTNFCAFEPPTLASLRNRPNVLHICKDKIVHGGQEIETHNETWQFGKFVELF